MNAEELLYQSLLFSGFTVYPQFAPQNAKKPYVVYNVTSDNTLYGLNFISNVQDVRFQIDVYVSQGRDSYDKLKKMIDRIKYSINHMDPLLGRSIIYGTSNSATEEGRRCKLDVKVWVRP